MFSKNSKSIAIGDQLANFFSDSEDNNLHIEFAKKYPDANLLGAAVEVKGYVITVNFYEKTLELPGFPPTPDVKSPKTVEFHITDNATIITPDKPKNRENAILLGEQYPEIYGMLLTGVLRANILVQKNEVEHQFKQKNKS